MCTQSSVKCNFFHFATQSVDNALSRNIDRVEIVFRAPYNSYGNIGEGGRNDFKIVTLLRLKKDRLFVFYINHGWRVAVNTSRATIECRVKLVDFFTGKKEKNCISLFPFCGSIRRIDFSMGIEKKLLSFISFLRTKGVRQEVKVFFMHPTPLSRLLSTKYSHIFRYFCRFPFVFAMLFVTLRTVWKRKNPYLEPLKI